MSRFNYRESTIRTDTFSGSYRGIDHRDPRSFANYSLSIRSDFPPYKDKGVKQDMEADSKEQPSAEIPEVREVNSDNSE